MGIDNESAGVNSKEESDGNSKDVENDSGFEKEVVKDLDAKIG